MTRGKKYEPSLHLDMDFDEALQRFSLTRKSEVDDLLSQTKREAPKGGEAMPLTWWKKLSVTDAQRPTTGRLVPYLRLTKAKNPQDNQTWFRHVFFAGEPWVNGHFGRHAVEQVDIDFEVTILGQSKGVRTMRVTHDDTRQDNNNTPNTWLHYDEGTLADFHAQNLAHRAVRVSKSDASVYSFMIT